MPIKFACPKCNKVMSVPDNLAGKSGKCICGNKLSIPAAKTKSSSAKSKSAKKTAETAPAGGGAPGLDGVFDELTESDYGRTSPFEAVYNPKKGDNNDLQTLRRFSAEEEEEKQKKASAAGGLLKLVAVLEIAVGIACIVFAAMYAASPDNIKKIAAFVPELSLATGMGITFLSISALICIGGAVGAFMKKSWGWMLTATVMIYLGVARLISAGLILKEGFDQGKFFGSMIPLFAIFALSLIVFKEEAKVSCGVKKVWPLIVAVVLALAGAGIVFGMVISAASK